MRASSSGCFGAVLSVLLLGGCAGHGRQTPTTPSATAESPDALLARGLAYLDDHRCDLAIEQGFAPAERGYEASLRASVPEGATVRVTRAPGAPALGQALGLAAEGTGGVVVASPLPDAIYLEAYCLIELGRLEDAEAALHRALAFTPDDVVYLSELGHILQARSENEAALAIFVRASDNADLLARSGAFPNDRPILGQPLRYWQGRALRGQGYSLVELGRLDEADAAYARALAIDPDDAQSIRERQLIARLRSGR